jgi:toxin HigB-1
MIISFKDKETEEIWNGNFSRNFLNEIQTIVRRKLRMINNSIDINDLRIPPANQLKKLKGNLSNYYSISINDQFRIIFEWENGNAFLVELIDYH